MYRWLLLILLWCVAVVDNCAAQAYIPADKATLNYRLVGFSGLKQPGIVKYQLEVAEGNYISDNEFVQHIVVKKQAAEPRFIAELPAFGQSYTWRISAIGNNSVQAPLVHFMVLPLPLAFNDIQVIIPKNTNRYTDAYFFHDGAKALYNMKGEVVWFLPRVGAFDPTAEGIRDLKASPQGTITFLGNGLPMEIDYNGKLLWAAPKTDSAELTGEGNFHHEFQRRKNGHYYVMGNAFRIWNKCYPGVCDSTSILPFGTNVANTTNTRNLDFTTILEYDNNGSVVWKWNSMDYIIHSDLFQRLGKDGFADIDAHANAFTFSNDGKIIYISFRNIDRVIALGYPSGKVLASYGTRYSLGKLPPKPMFSEQHSIQITGKSKLLMYNNNSNYETAQPNVLECTLPVGKGELRKSWEAPCLGTYPLLDDSTRKMGRHGGKVQELPDGSIMVANCSPYWSMYIIERNKKVTWEATFNKYNRAKARWEPLDSYRSEMIVDKVLIGRLIFGAN